MATSILLLEVGIVFAALALVGAFASRLDQSVIPFYIVVGMVLSPYVIGQITLPGGASVFIQETTFISIAAELGIVLLLFFLGLEFNIDRLLESKERIGMVGTVDLLINFSVGWLLGYVLFGASLPAFLTAGIVYISSSAIITKSLIDRGWIVNEEAQPILGTLVYEDLFIAIYLAIISALVLGGETLSEAMVSVGIALGFILLLFIIAYFGTQWFERLLRTRSHEFAVLRVLGVTVLIAGIALALGVSEAVAAFFVGMAFSSTEYVHDLEQLLEPLRDMFAAIFFFWIGLITDPTLFTGVIGVIGLLVVVTTPTKLVSGFISGRIYNLDARRSTRVGLALGTRGEFSLIIAAVALAGAGTTLTSGISQTIYAFTVGYVLVMSILGSLLMQYSGPLEAFATARFES
jgi:CPA2 family monovalent cation:H+ antiporter-2